MPSYVHTDTKIAHVLTLESNPDRDNKLSVFKTKARGGRKPIRLAANASRLQRKTARALWLRPVSYHLGNYTIPRNPLVRECEHNHNLCFMNHASNLCCAETTDYMGVSREIQLMTQGKTGKAQQRR